MYAAEVLFSIRIRAYEGAAIFLRCFRNGEQKKAGLWCSRHMYPDAGLVHGVTDTGCQTKMIELKDVFSRQRRFSSSFKSMNRLRSPRAFLLLLLLLSFVVVVIPFLSITPSFTCIFSKPSPDFFVFWLWLTRIPQPTPIPVWAREIK